MGKQQGSHLILVGGGHAHLMTIAGIDSLVERGHRVTVIGPSPHHYYSGMGPGMLSGMYSPEEIRFDTRKTVEENGGTFVEASVDRVDSRRKKVYLQHGGDISYDVISFNVGSYVPQIDSAAGGISVFTVKPIEMLLEARSHILRKTAAEKVTIAVVGGGPAALEVTGNVWRLCRDNSGVMPEIVLYAGKRFLSRFSEAIRRKAQQSLTRRGIRIISGSIVAEVASDRIRLESGKSHEVDVVFLAHGVKPSDIFRNSGLPTGPDGGLRVNRFLQCSGYPQVFGGGDCIDFEPQPLDKVGVYAVRQNPVLFHNLAAFLEGRPLKTFDPGGSYLLAFNLGDGTGLVQKKGITFGGRLAFRLKDTIDRRFMRRFQSI